MVSAGSGDPRRAPVEVWLGVLTRNVLLAGALAGLLWNAPAHGVEAQWIWTAAQPQGEVPQGACYFRKEIDLESPEEATLEIAADDEYELYLNGQLLGRGDSRGTWPQEYDISKLLAKGRNLVAVKVVNSEGGTAAVAVRVAVRERGESIRYFSTDRSWKTNVRPLPLWNMVRYSDARWRMAQELGQYGRTPPWDEPSEPAEPEQPPPRFQLADGFQIEQVLPGEQTGPLTALTFNEFGHLLIARENGPLLASPLGPPGSPPGELRVHCSQIRSCRGVLPLNGEIFVTGEGPAGLALYRLADRDGDGSFEDVRPLIRFPSASADRGPHGLALGPDGMIYIAVGVEGQPDGTPDAASPYANFSEGDLLQPRCEDPRGYAAECAAPCGVILRTDIEGRFVQRVAGGLHNPRDLAFNQDGELFAVESGTELDRGTPWYRPAELLHVIPGAEFGWRSGWAKWPASHPDRLPGILEVDGSLPTAAAFYDHTTFPKPYQGVLFLADRAGGRVLAINTASHGASYTAQSEVFVQGQRFEVTDMDVGPDGCLYLATAGGGEAGGVYRVAWRSPAPAPPGEGITAAIRQPQFQSAWSRQAIAGVMHAFGSAWDKQLPGVARSRQNPAAYRIRALHTLQLFGPSPSLPLLLPLSQEQEPAVRAAAVDALGLLADAEAHPRLVQLLSDPSPLVRRRTCEALVRAGLHVDPAPLMPLLTSSDRWESTAARRLLERVPPDRWREQVLSGSDLGQFVPGALALLAVQRDADTARAVLERFTAIVSRPSPPLTDSDLAGMLRVCQLALIQGGATPDIHARLAKQLASKFPARDHAVNGELVPILVYLQDSSPLERYLQYLNSAAPETEKLHVALQMRFLQKGWQPGQRLRLVDFYEQSRQKPGGGSYAGYLANASRELAKTLATDEANEVLARGAEWPATALGVLYRLPASLDDNAVEGLLELDGRAAGATDEATEQLRVGIAAVLARSKLESAMSYLRQTWEREPERRSLVAMGLAQAPGGDNFAYLLRSLPILEGATAKEVLTQLATTDQRPTAEDSEAFRQVILLGLALGDDGASEAVALLTRWKNGVVNDSQSNWQEALTKWQAWYAQQYPHRPPAEWPITPADARWELDRLLAQLNSVQPATGAEQRGLAVFAKARCAKCHRLGGVGEPLGPDLTAIDQRLTRKEILRSVLHPSHDIAEPNRSMTLLTITGRRYAGLVRRDSADRWTVLQSNGIKVSVPDGQVRETVPYAKSAMSEGLLEPLSLEEIADLLAALAAPPPGEIASRPERSVR